MERWWKNTDMTCRKTCPRATLCTTNSTWTDLGLNPILHTDRFMTDCPRFPSRRKVLCSLECVKFDVLTVACWNVTPFRLVDKSRPNKGSLMNHFCVVSDLWQMLQAQGYQLDLVTYSEWYQKVKEAAGSTMEHSKMLTSLLYLLDTLVVYVSLAITHITCNHTAAISCCKRTSPCFYSFYRCLPSWHYDTFHLPYLPSHKTTPLHK